MQYTTGMPFVSAVAPLLQAEAGKAMAAPSPFSFQGSHQDLYNSLSRQNATGFDRAAAQADTDMQTQSRNLQTQMALRGLQQMAQAQDSQTRLANQVYGNKTGYIGSILSGLFQ